MAFESTGVDVAILLTHAVTSRLRSDNATKAFRALLNCTSENSQHGRYVLQAFLTRTVNRVRLALLL